MSSLETKEHLKSKELLFDWIITKQVEIYDNLGNKYEMMIGKNKNEFLHSESLVITDNNSVLYSSTPGNLPCNKLLKGDRDFTPMCDMKGHSGAIYDLPCQKCIKTVNARFHEIKLIPDLAYGYKNSYTIWLEIFKTSGSSFKKMKYCSKNNINLLEINVEDIQELEDVKGKKKLVFNNLTHYYNNLDLRSDIWKQMTIDFVNSSLDKYGYLEQRILLAQIDGLSIMKSQIKHRTKTILKELNLKSTIGKTSYFEELLNVYPKSNKILLLRKDKYDSLIGEVEDNHKSERHKQGKFNQVEIFLNFIHNASKGEYQKKDISKTLNITKLNRVLADPLVKKEENVSFITNTRTIKIV